MSQTRKMRRKSGLSKREQERIDARKASEKSSFSTIAMRVFIIVVLMAMVMGLAIQIIVYN